MPVRNCKSSEQQQTLMHSDIVVPIFDALRQALSEKAFRSRSTVEYQNHAWDCRSAM